MLLCLWHFPGKNTGVGYHFLLKGIFPMQRSSSHLLWLLHWQVDSIPLSHLGSPRKLDTHMQMNKVGSSHHTIRACNLQGKKNFNNILCQNQVSYMKYSRKAT